MPSSSRKKRGSHRSSYDGEKAVRIGLVALSCLILIACWKYGSRPIYENETTNPEIPADVEAALPYLAIKEVDRTVSETETQTILLDDAGEELLISDDTPKELRGSMNGTVRVNAPEQTVHILLNGVSIHAKEGSAILVEEADRVIITLVEGSENYISDSGSYPVDSDCDGCIYSPCALTFNGAGSLSVTGVYQDAIRSKDRVKILDGSYRIEAKRNAVRGNDGIRVDGGTLFLGSEKNGFMTTKSGPDGRGDLVISGGTLSIVAGRYAFVTEKARLYILNCKIETNSVVSDFQINGMRYIQDGCLQ